MGVKMKISIIGAGTVGEAVGVGLESLSYDVIFYDIDTAKVNSLKSKKYKATYDISDLRSTDVSFICVPTPTVNGIIDLSYVENASRSLGRLIREKEDYHLCVIKSTVIPGTTEDKIIPLLELESGKRNIYEFGVAVNSVFLRHKSALHDFMNPDRIVIGSCDPKPLGILTDIYHYFSDVPIHYCDLKTAETMKYVSNIFLASKISFFNEINEICKKIGADSTKISSAVAEDRRIGSYGTVGGRPFDSTCLSKDLDAFISFLESNGIRTKIIKSVKEVNEEMKDKYNPA